MPGLAQAGDGGVERDGGLNVAERILRAADQQVTEADVMKPNARAEITLGDVKLIATASKRFCRVAEGEDQITVLVALEGSRAGRDANDLL